MKLSVAKDLGDSGFRITHPDVVDIIHPRCRILSPLPTISHSKGFPGCFANLQAINDTVQLSTVTKEWLAAISIEICCKYVEELVCVAI